MSDRDPFWDSHVDEERARASATWPHALSTAVFWLAVVAIVYIAVRYG